MDLLEMFSAAQEEEQAKRWETAYWMSYLINLQLKAKDRITTDRLMKPFLVQDTDAQEKDAEERNFFREFYKQRREVMKGNVDNSGING